MKPNFTKQDLQTFIDDSIDDHFEEFYYYIISNVNDWIRFLDIDNVLEGEFSFAITKKMRIYNPYWRELYMYIINKELFEYGLECEYRLHKGKHDLVVFILLSSALEEEYGQNESSTSNESSEDDETTDESTSDDYKTTDEMTPNRPSDQSV